MIVAITYYFNYNYERYSWIPIHRRHSDLYLYFGYKEDYKRNPKGFLKTIVAVPIGVISYFMGLPVILNLMKRWTKEDNDEPKLL